MSIQKKAEKIIILDQKKSVQKMKYFQVNYLRVFLN